MLPFRNISLRIGWKDQRQFFDASISSICQFRETATGNVVLGIAVELLYGVGGVYVDEMGHRMNDLITDIDDRADNSRSGVVALLEWCVQIGGYSRPGILIFFTRPCILALR